MKSMHNAGQLSGELSAGMKYAYDSTEPAKPPALTGLTLPQTQNLHKYLAEVLSSCCVFALVCPVCRDPIIKSYFFFELLNPPQFL